MKSPYAATITKPSNVLYSTAMPSAQFSLRFDKNAVSRRLLMLQAEIRTARGGQPLNEDATAALRCMAIQGGSVLITRRRTLFKDGSGFADQVVLKIQVDEDETSSYNSNDPEFTIARHRAHRRSASIEAQEASASLMKDVSEPKTAGESCETQHSECGCSTTAQW